MGIESFNDRKALVTGGASGIGLGIVKTLSERVVGDEWMNPDAVGEMVAEAILEDRFYPITHGQFSNRMRERADAVLAATPASDVQF